MDLRGDAAQLVSQISKFVSSLQPAKNGALIADLNKASASLKQSFDLEYCERKFKSFSARRLQLQRNRFKRQRNALKADLQSSLGARVGCRLHKMWFVRCGLSDPNIPPRTLEQFCREFHGEEISAISHTSITKARNAFVELIKVANNDLASTMVATLPAVGGGGDSAPVVLSHVHDEACLRLRSFDAELGGVLHRARSSKVQNDSLQLFLNGNDNQVEMFSELQPLLNKTGATLGQALINSVAASLECFKTVAETPWSRLRFFHLLTGDGINTNQLASRYVLAHYGKMKTLGEKRFSYFLIPHVCSSHQANLAVATAIAGSTKHDKDEIVAACSRFFKHLLHDYTEEFALALKNYVEKEVKFARGNPMDDACVPAVHRQEALDLRSLYGEHVLPDDLLRFFNYRLSDRTHVADADMSIEHVRSEAFRLLQKHILKVEEKPVVTRFFLFGPCVNLLLTLKLLGLPLSLFQLSFTRPQLQNGKRLQKFQAFMRAPETDHRLRKAALCLQLTLHATALTAQKVQTTECPLLVRLGKREVQEKTSLHFQRLVRLLPTDPVLDIVDVLQSLLLTECHLIIRFGRYCQYPTRHWEMCKYFNEDGWVRAAESFLQTPDAHLDFGYGVLLKAEELRCIFIGGQGNSLEVERRHNQVKRAEKRKVVSVATASRNAILQRYRLQRTSFLAHREKCQKQMKKRKFVTARSLAVQKMPHLAPRPRGRLKWERDVSAASASSAVHKGDPQAFHEYYEAHKKELQEQAACVRQEAKALTRQHDGTLLPLTNSDWMEWLRKHDDLFKHSLNNATAARRSCSHRLRPDSSLVTPAPRLLPKLEKQQRCNWERILLQQKQGWFCLKLAPSVKVVCYCASLRGETFAVRLDPEEGQGRCFVLPLSPLLHELLLPIRDVCLKQHPHVESAEVFALTLQYAGYAGDSGLLLTVTGATPVSLKLQVPRRSRKTHDAAAMNQDDEEEDEDAADALSMPCSDSASDADTVVSQIEAEDLVEEPDDADSNSAGEDDAATHGQDEGVDAAGETVPRLPPGTHVVHSDEYFSIANFHTVLGSGDARIRMQKRWIAPPPHGMGTSETSKTVPWFFVFGNVSFCLKVQIQHYDDDIAQPYRTFVVLRGSRENISECNE
ncbi:unnamed protein product [Symbiodinium microadriaticum]|nr:unnamed protein product [Symbiodinium microadriaticum]CAE7266574.1 unnamed protein product [Symbiodinium sp. KB8]